MDTPAPDSVRSVARRTAKGDFAWLLYHLARACGLEQAQQVGVLGDGAPWIWNLVAEHFPGAVHIVDLYHAKEHVWEVAHAVFGGATAAATTWATAACSLLEAGQMADLVSAIASLPPIPPEPGQARSIPARAVDYFTINAKPHALSCLLCARHAPRQWHRRGRLQNHRQHTRQTFRYAASLLKASMPFCLCAQRFSMMPMLHSGKRNMPLACLQRIHTPREYDHLATTNK